MSEDFVEVYSKTTGGKQMVPRHYLDNPVLGKDLALTAAGRQVLEISDADPSTSWTRERLDEHASSLGIDSTGLANKREVLDAIDGTATPQSSPETGSTGPGGGADPDANNPSTDDPATAGQE